MRAYPGEACGALHDAYLACHVAATCDELAGQPDNELCSAERDALDSEACTLAICNTYADRLIECGLAAESWKLSRSLECSYSLLENRIGAGDACGDASEALMACVVALPCDQLNSGDACEAEEQASDEACL